MKWHTHSLVGANAAWIAILANLFNFSIPALMFLGALGGLLPDIDALKAKIHFIGGGILRPMQGLSEHRGFFHSITAVIIVLILAHLFLKNIHPLAGLVLALGYFSHIIIDGLNYGGVGYLFPFSRKKYHLLPKFLRSPIGGIVDSLLFVVGLVGVLALLFEYYQSFNNFSLYL